MAFELQVEGPRNWEFLLSDANITRSLENGLVKANTTVRPGDILTFDGVYLVPWDGSIDTSGDMVDTFAGIAGFGVVAGVAAVQMAYVAREAEVKEDKLFFPTESTAGGEKAAAIAAMNAKQIFVRGEFA